QDFQRLHFGLAQNQQVERIEVRWPSDVVQVIENVNVNQVLTITEQLSDGGIVADGPFKATSQGRSLELTSLGDDSVTFGFDDIDVDRTGLITIFKVNGGSRTQIGSFSLLQEGEPSGFSPRFSLSGDDIDEGDVLEFEIVEDGDTRRAIATATETGATLDFGGGTVLSLSPVEDDVVDYVSGDGDALDFSGTGGADIRFTVYREAAFDSTVGLYQVDNLNGDITVGNQTLSVGDAGYEEAALDRAVSDVNLKTDDGDSDVFTVSDLDGLYGTFITVVNNEAETSRYFSYESVNAGSADHVKSIGSNALGFEDLPGLGDADFDDIVITFDTVANTIV
ncbi:ASPIC/UnbV domain-containing protein, partial [cf. Phormidesmis sp. LEGE 11477]|uniref:ASPIC/UnbV domain-containing protein n=1 Tax=cf. Phormidesmis sp. LEGE 11477 TaxID=1828680 RepID=UPI00187F6C4E